MSSANLHEADHRDTEALFPVDIYFGYIRLSLTAGPFTYIGKYRSSRSDSEMALLTNTLEQILDNVIKVIYSENTIKA